MRTKVVLFGAFLFLEFLVPGPIFSNIIHIPSDQPTIQAGIDAAVNNDTIMVAPGRYLTNFDFSGKSVLVTSEAGPELTFLEPLSDSLPIAKFNNGENLLAILRGFTLQNTTERAVAVLINSGSPTIENNIFRNHISYPGGRSVIFVGGPCQGRIRNNIFYDNEGAHIVIWVNYNDAVIIENNTIYSGETGIIFFSTSGRVRNNIISGCNVGLYTAAGWTIFEDYNAIWGNNTNYSYVTSNPTDLLVNPLFIDSLGRNFNLQSLSPCINAGYNTAPYWDPDLTRNDIGARYYDLRTPSALNLNLGNENIAHVLNHTLTFYWTFSDSGGTQGQYKIELGTDANWAIAEIWQSGIVLSSDQFAIYSGSLPLEDGITYYYRVSVYNGTRWGNWKEAAFTMNEPPTAAVPLWPISNALVNLNSIVLKTLNASDPNGDLLQYDFEIYSDNGLSNLVASSYGVAEQSTQTNDTIDVLLTFGVTYWWRVRANDSWDIGEWSSPESFIARNPLALRVPSEYPNIQAGIDAAQEHDKILVAAGTYTGAGNRDLSFGGKNVILTSESGAEATIIDCEAGPMNAHWGIYLHNNENNSSVIDGFTIKNAFTDELGAIHLTGASPTIRHCIIAQNDCSGIYLASGARPIIDSCTISFNTIEGISKGFMGTSGPTLTNSVIKGNAMGGMTMSPWPGTQISGCTFINNGQYGIKYEGDPPKLANQGNQSFQTLNNISNCLIVNNTYGIRMSFGWSSDWTIRCTNSFGNDSGNWGYVPAQAGDTLGNISKNPLFCNAGGGDYHLASGSPCLPGNNTCGVLMGAFGAGCDYACGDVNGSGKLNLLDVAYIISYLYRGGPAPVAPDIDDVDNSGSTNLLDVSRIIDLLYRFGPSLPQLISIAREKYIKAAGIICPPSYYSIALLLGVRGASQAPAIAPGFLRRRCQRCGRESITAR
jgi:parallel beta-helix repeat protein